MDTYRVYAGQLYLLKFVKKLNSFARYDLYTFWDIKVDQVYQPYDCKDPLSYLYRII